MNALILLLTLTTSTLVLRSGDRIAVEGEMREEKGVVMFRSGGVLYSLPAYEIVGIDDSASESERESHEVRRLRVSPEERQRLIAELEKNHAGTPGQLPAVLPGLEVLGERADEREQAHEEWAWRREARAHEEAVRRAAEELALLEQRAADIRFKIHSLVSLGYLPHQFTYDSTLLVRTLEQIPYAQLQLQRARRAYDQFREDARRQGVLPGWLR